MIERERMKEKLNLRYWRERYGPLPVTIAVILGLLILVWASYRLSHLRAAYLEKEVVRQRSQLTELYQQIEVLEYQQHVAAVELDIERASNEKLQQEMAMAQDENFALRRELTFYQKIMAPELEVDGVSIERFELTQNLTPGHYHLRLSVVQLQQQREFVSGRVSIQLRGRASGATKTYDLLDLARLEDSQREFRMRYFSVIAGDFMIPSDLIPERIDVSVYVDGQRNPLQQQFYWSRLLETQSNSELELFDLEGSADE